MARIIRLAFLLGVAGMIFQNCAFSKSDSPTCNQRDHLEIVSLSIYPDPLPDMKRLEEWSLRLRFNGAEECQTSIRITEVERDIVTAETVALLRLGVNAIKLVPAQDYRFTANERCFKVVVASKESQIQIDGPQTFCALHIDNRWWTMR